MSIVIGIFAVLFARQIMQSKLVKGGYSLAFSFWVLGGICAAGFPAMLFWYMNHITYHSTASTWEFFGVIDAVAVTFAVFSLITFFAIWNSAKHASSIYKFLARYLSIALLGMPLAMAPLVWLDYLVMAGVGIALYYSKKPKEEVATEQQPEQVSSDT